jgi:hypothetical protein
MITHEGKQYARVSDILKPFSDFSHIDEAVLKNKCDLGTHVHQAINDDINEEFPILSSAAMGYFKSYEKWKNAVSPLFIKAEQRYFCDEKMITGCIDALISLPGAQEPILVDFKTSVSEAGSWIMQGHLYHYLLRSNGQAVSPRIFFLKLRRDGHIPVLYEYKFSKNIMAKCNKAIDLYFKMRKVDSH